MQDYRARNTARTGNHHSGVLDLLARSYRKSLESDGLSPATIRFHADAIAQLIEFLPSGAPPDDVSSEQIEAFLAGRRELSPANARSRYNGLRPFFAWMSERGHIDQTPFKHVKRPSPPVLEMPMRDDGQVLSLLDFLEGDHSFSGKRDRMIVALVVDTGMRRSEVVALTVSDFDMVAGTIAMTVRKGAKPPMVVFGDQTRLMIRTYLRARTKLVDRLNLSTDTLILTERGNALFPNSLWQALQRRARQAGIVWPEAMAHSFRRCFIHSRLAAGASLLDVAHLVGHSSLAMVARHESALAQQRASLNYASPLRALRPPASDRRRRCSGVAVGQRR